MSRLATLLCVAAVGLAGCGGDTEDHGGEDGENTRTAAGTPAPEVTSAAPGVTDLPSTPGSEGGRSVIASAGCLACHKIGIAGNDGPGPELTKVGSRLSETEIRRNLVAPTPPMPPYRHLPKRDLDDVVGYLAALR